MAYSNFAASALLGFSAMCAAAPLHMHQSAFKPSENGRPMGWTVWAAREEIAPKAYVDTTRYRTEPGSLAISGNSNSAEYGGWEYTVPDISPGKWYRFTAFYHAAGLHDEALQVVSRLDWRRTDG